MAALKEPVKIFIVQSLACFETPQQVADAVKQNYKIEIERQQVALYDPTKATGKNLSKKLTQLFNDTRKRFQENILDIPIAKPLEWFEPKNDGQLIFRKPQSSLEVDVFKTYPLKFFLTRRKPTFKQPYGDPLLSKLYWLWFFKTNSTKFWVKFLERFGSPLLVGILHLLGIE